MRVSTQIRQQRMQRMIQFIQQEFGTSERAITRVLAAEPQIARDNLQYALWMHGAIDAKQLSQLNQWLICHGLGTA
ncbi:MAG: DUF2949 domain-containing protein [Spirulinaceae cyanobacterium SM2_1_0]|nr:DUF2949 domain-containing protein [Spirulinaceae cyanobacterium SM2_1_0]